ncbi:MAG: hypothetical protein ABUT39_26320 [Acidobacteriota bacterium]
MPESLERSDSSLPASIMLAEHQRVSSLYLHNAAMGERRVTIHLLFVAGGGTLLLSLPQLMGLKPAADGSFFPIINQLILPGLVIVILMAVEGILTFQRLIERRVRATEYLRAINRINRYFVDRSPELQQYLPWPSCDNMPAFGGKTLGVADLRDLVAVLNCLYAGILGADLSLLVLESLQAGTYQGWIGLFAIALGLFVAMATWRWHSRYETSIVQKAEREFAGRVAFPASSAVAREAAVNLPGIEIDA